MITFIEANQARLSLKMKLSNYAWYVNSAVALNSDYFVLITINQFVKDIKNIIPPNINGVKIKIEID